MPQCLIPPLRRPPLSRQPYCTPLTTKPPDWVPGGRLTDERMEMMDFGPEGWLSEEEMKLLRKVLRLREEAISFCPEERGFFKREYGNPYIILVVDHQPWQIKPIPIPQTLRDQFQDLVKERVCTGLYKQSTSSYSSLVFAVLKQDKKMIHIVHDLQRLNSVTIQDAGLPPKIEELVDSMAGRCCYGLADIFGGYNQWELA